MFLRNITINWHEVINGFFKIIIHMRIYIETYGCSSSKNDSAIMKGLLERAGCIIVENIDNADVVIINTCGVKETTVNKILYRISGFAKGQKKLIVAGCMVDTDYSRVKDVAPDASLVGTKHIDKIVNVLQKEQELTGYRRLEKVCLPKHIDGVIDVVEICSGCYNNCAYCATKNAKGLLHSYDADKIVKEITLSRRSGTKEIWITGQDVASYGLDTGATLPILVDKITTEVKGKYWLRLGMMNPGSVKTMTKELIEIYKNEKVFKFLHLPVQSGSNKILEAMQRGYTSKDFLAMVQRFKKEIPDLTLWTDIIVGFPGESDEDFKKTCGLLGEIKPDFVNVSRYSVRPNTLATKMKQLSTEIKKERSRIASALVDELALEANKKWIGWEGDVIVDEIQKNNLIGRNFAYKPVALKQGRLGEIVNVKISGAKKTCLMSF
jgi:MiaB-like tRNA modifying enzyme